MHHQVVRYGLTLLFALSMREFAFGEQNKLSKILFIYKDKQYSVEDLTRVSDKEVASLLGEGGSKYDLEKCPSPEGWWKPALTTWNPTGKATRQDFYQHQCQGLLERFIRVEVFNLFKQRHSVDIKKFYRAELVQQAMLRTLELQARLDHEVLTAVEENISQQETIKRLNNALPGNDFTDQDWIRAIEENRKYWAIRVLNNRCFPSMVEGKPTPWVEQTFYSSLVRYHIQAEIERDKPKYIRMLEDRFGTRNFFVIRKAQETDKEQLIKLINLVTNRRGTIARGGLERINKTLQELNSPTRVELRFGAAISMAKQYKIAEDQIKSREFISLGKTADGLESYLYIFQEEPTPHFKEYSSVPGNFLYSTAKYALLRPLVKEVRASIKPSKKLTIRDTDQMIRYMGDQEFSDAFLGIKLPKVVLVPEH